MKTPPALYITERHEHGSLICAAPGQKGSPLDAMARIGKSFPKRSMIDGGGIVASFNRQEYHLLALMAVGLPTGLKAWRKEIDARLADRPAEERWWCGTDTGASSCSIFRVLCPPGQWKMAAQREVARETAPGAVPSDAGDFGRCQRLIELIPEWRERLPEVAAAYPASKWPAIIERWDELVAADNEARSVLLSL